MLFFFVLCACACLSLQSTNTNNIDIELGTYLTSKHSPNVISDVIGSSSGSSWIGGSGDFDYGLNAKTIGSGSGEAFILEVSDQKPRTLYRIAGSTVLNHIRAGPNNMIVASGDFGIIAFDTSNGNKLWALGVASLQSNCSRLHGANYQGGNCRLNVGSDSTTAAMVQTSEYGYQLYVVDGTGTVVSNVTHEKNGHHYNDIAIIGKEKMLVYTYFYQTYLPSHLPVQVPCIESYDYTQSNPKWHAYCWSGGDCAENQADSRGELLYMNDEDGYLYFGGVSYGGNTVFRYTGTDLKKSIDVVGYDAYTETYNTGSEAITFFSRMDPSSGDIKLGQFIIGREIQNGKPGHGNSVSPVALAADKDGNVYVAQGAACCIADRSNLTVNGQPCGPYGGDAAILVVSSDFTSRLHWNVFSKVDGSSPIGVGVGGGVVSFVANMKDEGITDNTWSGTEVDGSGAAPYLAIWKSP